MPGPVPGAGNRRVSKAEKASALLSLHRWERTSKPVFTVLGVINTIKNRGHRVNEGFILDQVIRGGFPEEVTFNQSLK